MTAATGPVGRREASKQATRAALRAAAKRLFAEHGYQATTVHDIASAARVTERTFYRYFDGKEGLLADEFLDWLAALADAIRARPPGEDPVTAVRRAMISVSVQAGLAPGASPAWPLGDRPPLAGLRRAASRPLLRFEAAVAAAVLARICAAAGREPVLDGPDQEYRAQVIARLCVAAFRSAMLRHQELWRRRQDGSAASPALPGVEQLLDAAFAIIAGH